MPDRCLVRLPEVWSGSNPGVRRRRRGQKTEIVLSAVTCRDITPRLLTTAGNRFPFLVRCAHLTSRLVPFSRIRKLTDAKKTHGIEWKGGK